jgi:hypothetical protein
MKSRRMRLARHNAFSGKKINDYTTLVGKSEERGPLEIQRCRCEK